jgi:hypothetical protein
VVDNKNRQYIAGGVVYLLDRCGNPKVCILYNRELLAGLRGLVMNRTELAIVEHIGRLSETDQEQVLAYVQQLEQRTLQPALGDDIIALVQSLEFDPQDVDAMAQAIEEACEQIEPDDTAAL